MKEYHTEEDRIKGKKAYNKKWHSEHPNYMLEWRKKNKKKAKQHMRQHYLNKREAILKYYAKRNSKTEVKQLVGSNIEALLQMPLQDLFVFQALRMKSSTPVSMGAFLYAIKQNIFNSEANDSNTKKKL